VPTSLVYVPEEYLDNSGMPMTLTRSANGSQYLSRCYADSDFECLERLGVKKMTFSEFLEDLKSLTLDHSDEFRQKDKKYHARLAKILVPMLDQKKYMSLVRTIPLIRLRGGRCVSAEESSIFFPGETAGWDIPMGVDALVVQSYAERDSNIHSVYSSLGVKRLNPTQICQLIINTHMSESFNPSSLALKDLRSHATFLFNACWKSSGDVGLWFATENCQYYKGSQLYQDSSSKRLFGGRNTFHFLHRDYFSDVGKDRKKREKLITWLHEEMDIWHIPRLVTLTPGDGFSLSPHFDIIIQERPSSDFLLLLRDHWQHYSKWLVEEKADGGHGIHGADFNESVSRLKETLSSRMVQCLGNVTYKLRETFLPLEDILSEKDIFVPLLKVPDPEDKGWQVLKHFGVGVRRDVHFYLRSLERLVGEDPTAESISTLLEHIQTHSADDPLAAR
jgi:hypothetical protein